VFLRYLRANGHTGRLSGLDQSAGMIAAAAEASDGLDIEWQTGGADALPFPDGAFSAVSARHMLYHVPDVPAALAEFGRVAGPGGTVFAATNHPHTTPHLIALEDDMLAHFGLPGRSFPAAGFNTVNAPDLLGSVYAEVEEIILTNALVFTEPDPIVRYVMSWAGSQQSADRPGLFAEMHGWLTAEATARLAAKNGLWRDPKIVGLYRCKVG